jgi:hypothetical protein
MLTTDQGEVLKKEADAAKAKADKLKATWQKAREVVDGLTVELAALPSRKIEAITDGDLGGYVEVGQREAYIPAELTLTGIAAARAAVNYYQAYKDWSLTYRAYCRFEADRLGGPEYPEGTAKGIAAETELGNAQAIASSSGLGDAQRNLQALIDDASRARR